MSARAADEPLPGFNFRVSWADRQIASISSVSALRLDTGVGEQMLPGPVEFARARSGDDAFEVWAADPAPRAVTVAVLDAGGASSLTFVLEDAVPVSYTALDGLDADSADTLRERLVVRCRAIRRVPTPATGGHPQELLPRPMQAIRRGLSQDRAFLRGAAAASFRMYLEKEVAGRRPYHHDRRVFRVDRHEVDGVTLAVRSWPCRVAAWPPVVVLPGTGATAGDWDVIAARLCADRTVFAIDLRGHGDSSWPGTYAISLMAADVIGLLAMLSAEEADLVGHSLGGLVACQVAASEKARVRRLVLEDTGMPHPRPPQAPARPAGPLGFDWAVVEQIRPEIDEPDSRWPQIMAAVHVPTLVIGGGTTSFLPQEHVAELARTVAHGTCVTIDAGHLVHATKPGAFLAELTAFLNS